MSRGLFDNAIEGTDYIGIDGPFRLDFSTDNKERLIFIEALQDNIVEDVELFSMYLYPTYEDYINAEVRHDHNESIIFDVVIQDR
jgi:hypothetical protein